MTWYGYTGMENYEDFQNRKVKIFFKMMLILLWEIRFWEITFIKKLVGRVREMDQQLRVLAALAEDLGLTPITYMWANNYV